MKQKIWRQKFVLLWVLIGTCIFGYRAEAAVMQEKNMVLVFALDVQGKALGCCNGVVVSQNKENAIVITKSDEIWDEAADYCIEGPDFDSQRVYLDYNDLQSGAAVFGTDIQKGGFPYTELVGCEEMYQDQIVYQGGMDLDTEADSLSDRVLLERTMISAAGEIDGYIYMQMEDAFRPCLSGGPVFTEDGRLAGIMVDKEQVEGLFLPIEYVTGGAIAGLDDYELKKTPYDVFFLILIPVVGILFVVSLILYVNREKKRKAAGEEEFSNVLMLGGEEGLRIRGKSGYFKEVDFPLTETIVFGRDPLKANAVYPTETNGISREHCRIEMIKGKLLLTDLGSTYGTFLKDGTRLAPNKPYELKFGDEFYLSDVSNTFRIV